MTSSSPSSSRMSAKDVGRAMYPIGRLRSPFGYAEPMSALQRLASSAAAWEHIILMPRSSMHVEVILTSDARDVPVACA